MTDSMSIVRYLNATNTKRAAFGEAVRIMANADPLVRRLDSLFFVNLTAFASQY